MLKCFPAKIIFDFMLKEQFTKDCLIKHSIYFASKFPILITLAVVYHGGQTKVIGQNPGRKHSFSFSTVSRIIHG
jgi:hypothetical protein